MLSLRRAMEAEIGERAASLGSNIAKPGQDKASPESHCRQNATVASQPAARGVVMIAMHASIDLEGRNPGNRP